MSTWRFAASVVAIMLAIGAGACGGTDKPGSTNPRSSAAAVAPSARGKEALDGDGDRDGGLAAGTVDAGIDRDDGEIRGAGHAANVADDRAVTALVREYYATASGEDAAKGCSLLYYILAESLPEEYGGPPGPRYLQGARSCRAVLSIVFKHFHAQLIEAPQVTGVRVMGKRAYALLRWTMLPAGYIEAEREGTTWKIDRVLAAPMP